MVLECSQEELGAVRFGNSERGVGKGWDIEPR